MAEVRLQIPDEALRRMQEKLGSTMKATDIARDAITLFNWAIEERAKGNVLLSATPKGEDMIRLAMPSLEAVRRSE